LAPGCCVPQSGQAGSISNTQVSRPGPGWQALTDLANAMLEFDPEKRPSATDCSTKLSRVGAIQTDSEVQQYLMNLDFLQRQKTIPNVSNSLLPLISKIQINLESNMPITDSLEARKILGIPPKEWGSLLHETVDKVRSNVERPQPFALNDLASLLAASSETNS
jgi:serine/threonine protein kinase